MSQLLSSIPLAVGRIILTLIRNSSRIPFLFIKINNLKTFFLKICDPNLERAQNPNPGGFNQKVSRLEQ